MDFSNDLLITMQNKIRAYFLSPNKLKCLIKTMLYRQTCLFICAFRHIQDPASQRLTWNKPPKSVLIIKKIRDASLLQPFKELCIFLTQVRTPQNVTHTHTHTKRRNADVVIKNVWWVSEAGIELGSSSWLNGLFTTELWWMTNNRWTQGQIDDWIKSALLRSSSSKVQQKGSRASTGKNTRNKRWAKGKTQKNTTDLAFLVRITHTW